MCDVKESEITLTLVIVLFHYFDISLYHVREAIQRPKKVYIHTHTHIRFITVYT